MAFGKILPRILHECSRESVARPRWSLPLLLGYAVKNLVENVLWLGHARVAVRSDNEPAIIKLVNTAFNLLKLSGLDVTGEGSIEYDPQSNGAAESAVRVIKGQVRALQVGFENDIKFQHSCGPSRYLMACAARSHGQDNVSCRS